MPIGMGSSREVYSFDNDKVIKKSIHKKGIEQNKIECFLSNKSDVNDILTVVYDHSDDYKQIISERVKTISEDDITKYLKYFYFLDTYFIVKFKLERSYFKHSDATEEFLLQKSSGVSYKTIFKKLDENIFVQKLCILITKYSLNPDDLCNYKNYGLANNELKLIDYGLTI